MFLINYERYLIKTVVKQLFPWSAYATNSSVFVALAFTCHHWTRFKSLLTGTFKTSNHILAGPISARIAHRTFISICKWSEVEKGEWRWNGLRRRYHTFHSLLVLGSAMSCLVLLFLKGGNVRAFRTQVYTGSLPLLNGRDNERSDHPALIVPMWFSAACPEGEVNLSLGLHALMTKIMSLHAARGFCWSEDKNIQLSSTLHHCTRRLTHDGVLPDIK